MNPNVNHPEPSYNLPSLPKPFRFNYTIPGSSGSSTMTSTVRRTPMAGGRQITRNRASYSCHTCRRRKVKCDKVHPVCGNCLKNGSECVYDATPKKDPNSRNGHSKTNQGVKRRREMSRSTEEEVDEIQSTYGETTHTQSPDQKPGSQAIEARLDKLTSMIERLSKTNRALDQADRQLLLESASVQRDSRQINGQSGKLAGNSNSHSRQPSPRRAAESTDEFPIPSGHATDLVDPVGSLNLGHLSLDDGGRSRYVGTTYWAYISHEINELNQLLRDQNRSHNEPASNEDSIDVDETMADPLPRTPGKAWKSPVAESSLRSGESGSRGEFHKGLPFPYGESPTGNEKVVEPEMLDHVPTKRQSHILYKGFMSGVHAISPVVHPPTVLKSYNAFWDWYDYSSYSGDPCPDPPFIPLLYAIWYGGSVTISIRTIKAEFDVNSRSELSKLYNDEVTRWLNKVSFPRSPTLQGLSAYLIVQTILSKEEEPLTSSLFISLAMRVAQTMGLHRDPAKFGIGPCEAEYRRRLWWHIVHMDGVVAMSSGLPPLVSDENYWDVRETSEVKDTLLGTPEAEQYDRLVSSNMRVRDTPDYASHCGGPSMVNVYYLSARGKYVMARAVRRILKIQLGTKPLTRRDMEDLRAIILELQLQLNAIINRISDTRDSDASSNRSLSFSSRSPVEVRTSETELPGEGPTGCAEQYHSPVLIAFHKWARILLSLFIDKAYCVAYQPFLKNAKSRIWPAARQSALRHCHGFMEKFISLASDPDFQPFQWSWPGNHQPMHATMIMLIDLYERPYSPEAPKSRAFIDKIFSLSGPDGGVVGGEDGVSTQRPLKDGGREAWDMIRRLRQKAWQRAGLDPHKLWTEKAQMQAGLAPVDEYGLTEPYQSPNGMGSATTTATTRKENRPQWADRPATDFLKTFYNMTKSQSHPASARPSPLRQQVPPTVPHNTSGPETPPTLSTPPFSHSPTGPTDNPTRALDTTLASSGISTPAEISQLHQSTLPLPHQSSTTGQTETPQSRLQNVPFMDPASPSIKPDVGDIPTPPSMVDPNLNFDWDQWDAVFGQHLPVADELMELDPVTGFEFGDLGNGRLGLGPGGRGGGFDMGLGGDSGQGGSWFG